MPNSIEINSGTTYWLDDSGLKITRMTKGAFGDVINLVILESDWDQTNTVWRHMEDIFRAGKRAKMDEIKRALEIRT